MQIVAQLRLIRSTSVIVAIAIPDLDGTATHKFVSRLERAQWAVSRHVVRYTNVGDSVEDSCVLQPPTSPALRQWSLLN